MYFALQHMSKITQFWEKRIAVPSLSSLYPKTYFYSSIPDITQSKYKKYAPSQYLIL